MTTPQRYAAVVEYFSKAMPVAESELEYTDPFQLLVAVILSAQCTDKRVNMTTPALFAAFPTAEAMAAATAEEIYPYIRSISYPNNKAKNLAGMARMLVAEFGGVVPSDLDQLQRLPGVGRKTANLILGDVHGTPGVVVADTHCIRISGRLGLTDGTKDPGKVEQQLRQVLPPEESNNFCHRMVLHGRAVCTARKAKCEECVLASWCDYAKAAAQKAENA